MLEMEMGKGKFPCVEGNDAITRENAIPVRSPFYSGSSSGFGFGSGIGIGVG
jgi:hypothetical protein